MLVFLSMFVCLTVCLLTRLLKNASMDLNEMLRVDRCRTWTNWLTFEPDPDHSPIRIIRYRILRYGTLQSCLGYQRAALLRGILRKIPRIRIAVVLKWLAAKRYLVNFRLKISPLVATIFRSFSGNETSNIMTVVFCQYIIKCASI